MISNRVSKDDPTPAWAERPLGLSPAELRGFYRWSSELTATLVRLRGLFGGDLDRYLIQSVFIHAEMQRGLGAGGARGLNALSLAEITRIPRETTRRKLKQLAGDGFLSLGPDGLHYLGGRYAGDRFLGDLAPLYTPPSRDLAPAEPRSWRPPSG
jgi:hypothetical protein